MNNILLIFIVVLAICVLDLIIILFDEKRYEKARDANLVEQAEIIRLQLSRKGNETFDIYKARYALVRTQDQKEHVVRLVEKVSYNQKTLQVLYDGKHIWEFGECHKDPITEGENRIALLRYGRKQIVFLALIAVLL